MPRVADLPPPALDSSKCHLGEGISILDTDLEVDFAPPVGSVEPERRKATPQSTIASKLNIDLSQTPGSSRPASLMGGNFSNK